MKKEIQMNESVIRVEGYASVFNIPDQEGDIITPGAFQRFIRTHPLNIPVLWQHYPNVPIGKLIDATEDAYGLCVKLEICTETQLGREAVNLIECGILKGLSIGFKVIKSTRGSGKIRRLLNQLNLKEISIVTFPAQEKAIITHSEKKVARV
jgi:uncharacterized protein